MSDECAECGGDASNCKCKDWPKLSIRQISISEEIQAQLASIIIEYLDEKPSLIDALDWVLAVIVNDYSNNLDIFENSWKRGNTTEIRFKDDPIYGLWPYLDDWGNTEDSVTGGFICRLCAIKLNAVPPKGHICTWHRGMCDFCGEEANLCHTSDWNWPDARHLEEGREL